MLTSYAIYLLCKYFVLKLFLQESHPCKVGGFRPMFPSKPSQRANTSGRRVVMDLQPGAEDPFVFLLHLECDQSCDPASRKSVMNYSLSLWSGLKLVWLHIHLPTSPQLGRLSCHNYMPGCPFSWSGTAVCDAKSANRCKRKIESRIIES